MKIFFILIFVKLSSAYLFDYGQKDTIISTLEQESFGPINLSSKYNIGEIFIHTDGYIVTKDKCFILAVFITSIKDTVSSDIYYREIIDRYNLSKYSMLVKKIVTHFEAKWAFLITWNTELTKLGQITRKNIYQMLIISNGHTTYILLNYYRINWPFYYTNSTIRAGHRNRNCKEKFITENFNNSTAKILRDKTNIDLNGLWIQKIENFKNNNKKNTCSKLILISLFIIYYFV